MMRSMKKHGGLRYLYAFIILVVCTGSPVFPQASSKNEIPTISVLDFYNTSAQKDFDWLVRGLSDMLSTDLASSGRLTLVERRDMSKLVKEQELALSGLVDEKNAPQLGKLVGASRLAWGSFVVVGTELRIDARVVESETGKSLAAASVQGENSKALILQAELAGKILASLGLDKPIGAGTQSLEAARSYYTGLILFDSGKYNEALTRFTQATQSDPLYAKPRLGIEEAYKFLKDFKRQRALREMNALISDIEALKRRLAAPVFLTFGAALSDPKRFGYSDGAAVSAAFQAHPSVWNGETPVQAMWYLQHLYMDLASKGAEQSGGDHELNERCTDEIAAIARVAESRFASDPFLPEVLYSELFGLKEREQWQHLKDACERLMTTWPDYRMMWAIEDMYEAALEKLK